MSKTITIGAHRVGQDQKPFIVAEISGNHNQSLERALEIVKSAHSAGVHAIKLQTYTPDTMTLDVKTPPFFISDKKSLWAKKSLYDLYKVAYTPWELHKPIFDYCKKLGLVAFSSPFDVTAVDFLETLDSPCYKIASQEIVHHPLIAKAASTGKPLILSTGGATLGEIDEAVQVARDAGCKDLILLKCTSAYPAEPKSFNLRTLPHLRESFDTLVGLSDHSLSLGVPISAISLGACLIEKHITLSRKEGGVDAAFSLEPKEFEELVKESMHAWQAQGTIHYGSTEAELLELSHRRSLYFARDIKAHEKITAEDVRPVRPGGGLHPKYLSEVIGAKAVCDIAKGSPVSWNLLLGKNNAC